MINKIKEMLSNRFTKGVVLISGGTVLAQIISALSSLIIARLYSPEEYGILALYSSVLSILAIAGSLKYDWGIPIADDEDVAINVVALSTLITSFISGTILFLLILFGQEILALFNGEELANIKYFIPLGVFLTSLYTIFYQWALREKNFKEISGTKLIQSLYQNIAKIGLGFTKSGPIGLIIGTIVGQSAGIKTLSKSFLKKENLKKLNLKKIFWCAKRYKKFPIYSAPSQIMNTAGIQLPIILLTSLYGAEVVGYYGLANTIVNLPVALIGTSVSDVFYAEAASEGRSNPEKLKKLSRNLVIRLLFIGAIPLIALLIAGPQLFALVYGDNWSKAGIYGQIIAFMVYARFVFTPITIILTVFEKQLTALILDAMRLVFVLVVFWVGNVYKLSSYKTIILYAVAMSFIYLVSYVVSMFILNKEIKNKNIKEQKE